MMEALLREYPHLVEHEWCHGIENVEIVSGKMANGATVYKTRCRTCAWIKPGLFVKKTVADSLPSIRDVGWFAPPSAACSSCYTSGSERHHVAPRHLFGDESDLWPVIELCRKCHQQWHDIMTPGMSNRQSQHRPVSELSEEVVHAILAARRRSYDGSLPWGTLTCRFCGTPKGVMDHSWAPTGCDATTWPSSFLCGRCTNRWLAHFPGHTPPVMNPDAVPF